ncbi:hypothetical protein [Bradyrhizobium zhanjiangense]|uniref:Uncharacterized protein n=1 Tax=Bradyrhizobium zhanjiangense TaxID=1325107 RepID=A0A4Q0RUN4_9BRAD|nr:hypothetical protein [Bradyrhizobium zhanjiangense]RXH22445.1 hypothetical protein XH94_37485 [Bradyrhizobium zhanjiangense]
MPSIRRPLYFPVICHNRGIVCEMQSSHHGRALRPYVAESLLVHAEDWHVIVEVRAGFADCDLNAGAIWLSRFPEAETSFVETIPA